MDPARAGKALARLQHLTERDWDTVEMDSGVICDLIDDVLLLIVPSICLLRAHGLKLQLPTLTNGFARILHIIESLYIFVDSKLAQLVNQNLMERGWDVTLASFSRHLTNVLSSLRDGVLDLDGVTGGILLQDLSFADLAAKMEVMFLKGLKLLVNTTPCITARDPSCPPMIRHHLSFIFYRMSP